MSRGDVVLVRFPHPSGLRGKRRPAVVVQADRYLATVGTVVVAEVTSNVTMAADPACLFIDLITPDGRPGRGDNIIRFCQSPSTMKDEADACV